MEHAGRVNALVRSAYGRPRWKADCRTNRAEPDCWDVDHGSVRSRRCPADLVRCRAHGTGGMRPHLPRATKLLRQRSACCGHRIDGGIGVDVCGRAHRVRHVVSSVVLGGRSGSCAGAFGWSRCVRSGCVDSRLGVKPCSPALLREPAHPVRRERQDRAGASRAQVRDRVSQHLRPHVGGLRRSDAGIRGQRSRRSRGLSAECKRCRLRKPQVTGNRANGPACTPGSVRGPKPRGRSSLSATRCRATPAAYPGTRRAASTSPVWPCSGRGLPRGSCHHDPGGLLHHPFTLTRSHDERGAGGLLSVALSRGLLRVGVTHRPALWSPDVPRHGRTRDATVQPTHSRHPVYRRVRRRPAAASIGPTSGDPGDGSALLGRLRDAQIEREVDGERTEEQSPRRRG